MVYCTDSKTPNVTFFPNYFNRIYNITTKLCSWTCTVNWEVFTSTKFLVCNFHAQFFGGYLRAIRKLNNNDLLWTCCTSNGEATKRIVQCVFIVKNFVLLIFACPQAVQEYLNTKNFPTDDTCVANNCYTKTCVTSTTHTHTHTVSLSYAKCTVTHRSNTTHCQYHWSHECINAYWRGELHYFVTGYQIFARSNFRMSPSSQDFRIIFQFLNFWPGPLVPAWTSLASIFISNSLTCFSAK